MTLGNPIMSLSAPIYYVDAFTDTLFHGNPAAVVLLDNWLSDEQLIAIAAEVNLSETAFLVDRHIRWFTPKVEVKLCGHATLAAAFVLNHVLQQNIHPLTFSSLSGELVVTQNAQGFTLDFPIIESVQSHPDQYPHLADILGIKIKELWIAKDRYLCFLEGAELVQNCQPDMLKLSQLSLPGLTITAESATNDCDFVSRYFAPAKGVDEDPVTGTSHCAIAPIWANRLNKVQLVGHQISSRGGVVHCELASGRVKLTGNAVLFLTGQILI
ncbi:PhzF family phenazine biosynthesis protein [Providencia rettgeri]|nr:PhzF family phenazine biosynthesis protein [Providencia rettgeri]ELR5117467.1 PhzF family phenazine biosynthesis protein [Providencia rettgeri]MBI6201215.1 PhzF family phenazine biosynthesis protein [Providencia rettgeri]QXB04699.1 PhzF family phenazine biosynthesis protein [Providencia rettgeri]HBK4774671.1 PhzF family phenazine biosynthesis protein [Providencia rettgeri]